MILKKKIPRDFYKLFRTQNMEYYMQLLTALYEADQEAYALTQLTDSECRSILAETIARVNLVWWEDETEKTEDEGFPGLSPSAVLDRFVKWGWLIGKVVPTGVRALCNCLHRIVTRKGGRAV